MTCRDVVSEGLTYRFCEEAPVPDARRLRALFWGQFIDELSEQPLAANLRVSTEARGFSARTTPGGFGGLTGFLQETRPRPDGAIDLTVSAARYVTRRFLAPPGSLPLDLTTVAMHRMGTVLRGRAVADSGAGRQPLGGARVFLEGVWRAFPRPQTDPLAVVESPTLVALAPTLYRDRIAGTDVLRRCDLTPLEAPSKRLVAPASAGEDKLWVSNALNLGAGRILVIESAGAERAEYVPIASVEAGAAPEGVAEVTLSHPLAHDHPVETFVVPSERGTTGADNALLRDGVPGDCCVHLATLTDLDPPIRIVELRGSGEPEFHAVSRYSVVSDSNGYYRLPAISRVAQLALRAEHASVSAPVRREISPDYDQFENQVDLVFV
jgi:hypothetical protein